MPKETFFNLPAEKRKRIIDAALEEFSTYSFHKARITAIADRANIAKGSFYQYFEDKKDLYKFLVKLLSEKKLSYINADMMANRGKYSFFQLLREVYLSGIRFAKENSRLIPMGMMLATDKGLLQEIYGESQHNSKDFFQELLEYGKAKGELAPELDVALVSNMLVTLTFSLTNLIIEDGKLDMDDMEIIDKMLDLVENGIKKRD